MRIRTLIVDDEPLAREGIRRKVEMYPEICVIAECSNGREAVDTIQRDRPELVFLDVQMPLLDGFGVIEFVGVDEMPPVIFVTAYDEFALQAFETHAFDYLLKPVTDERLDAAMIRAIRHIRGESGSHAAQRLGSLLAEFKTDFLRLSQPQYLERISVRTKDRILIQEVSEIEWISSMDNYVQLVAGDKTYTIRETMSGLERKLDPTKFIRVRRSAIVNVTQIRELHPLFNGEYVLTLRSGARLQSSRRYRKNLDLLLEY